MQTLKELFKRLKAANLVARPTKCVFGATQVDLLSHCFGQGVIRLQDVNVQKMRDAPRPTTKKEIRSFLGLAGYYQDFIPNFAAIAAPLFDLTRKGQPNKVVWGEPQERCYHTLKHAIVSKPVLMLPNVNGWNFYSTNICIRCWGWEPHYYNIRMVRFFQWLTLAENYWTEKEDIP